MRWKQIRGGLLAVAVLFMFIDGCPIPAPGDENDWNRDLSIYVLRPGQHYLEVPFRWLKSTLRIGERWNLFSYGPPAGFRFVVEGQGTDGIWRVTFRAGDEDHQDNATLINYERIRGSWDPINNKPPVTFDNLAKWVTHRELEIRPELVAARVRFERVLFDHGVTTETTKPADRFWFTYTEIRGKP